MSNVWFCSDLHFGHSNIGKFRNTLSVNDEESNRFRIMDEWIKSVKKKDVVYVLGDAAFTLETVGSFSELPGTKYLVRGNHDILDTSVYLKYFRQVFGIVKYKEFWLSHAPIHPLELRGKINLHGHVHYSTLEDKRYFNCCPENLWKIKHRSLISLQEIRELINEDRPV